MSSNVNGMGYESATGYTGHHIFIDGKSLYITENGTMVRQKKPCLTEKAWKARGDYLSECSKNGQEPNKEIKRQIKKQAAEESKRDVSVPLELVDEIDSHLKDVEQLRALKEKVKDNEAALQAKIKSNFWKMYGDPGTLVPWKE